MIKIITAILSFLALSGCAFLQNSTTAKALSVVMSATNLTYYYETGQAVEFVGNAELTDFETTQILEALDQVERSKHRLKSYQKSPERIITDLPQITFEYAKLKSAYLSVRQVVLDNESEYADLEWETFVRFDISARTLDEQFQALIEAAEANAAIMTALRLADTALKATSLI